MRSTTAGTGTLYAEAAPRCSLAGGTTELLAGGRGIGFESHNDRDLARAIHDVLEMDTDATARMCDLALNHALKSHPDALIPAWNDLLRQTIQSARTT